MHRELVNCLQSCAAPGVAAFGTLGAITGRDMFSARMADGDTTPYFAQAVDATTLQPTGHWERGIATWNAGASTLSRSVAHSSNGDAAVNFNDALVYVMGAAIAFDQPVYFLRQSASRTLTNTASAQKLFTTTASGALRVEPGCYHVELLIDLTTMSATSGNAQFQLKGAGTATLDAANLFQFIGYDNSTELAAGARSGSGSASGSSAASAVAAGTGTGLLLQGNGAFRVTAGGTIIPSVALVTAAAATLAAGSYIRVQRVAETTDYAGPWS